MSNKNNNISEMNYQLLEKNIRMLIENNDITQQQLAKIAGMTQANVSKSLNPNEKKHFTLEQVYRIAQYFGVSIDSLVGNPAEKSAGTSPRDAFLFITKFLSAGRLRTAELTVKETKYEQDYGSNGEYKPQEFEDTYPVFFFPDYHRFSDYRLSEQDEVDLHMEFCAYGNDTRFLYLNEILKKMIPLTEHYRNGDIPE